VIGVLPRAFRFGAAPEPPDLWIPLGQDPLGGVGPRSRTWARAANYLGVAGLRAADGSAAVAQVELEQLAQRLSEEHAYMLKDWRLRMESLSGERGADAGHALLVLLGAVLVMLGSACANLAGLTLVRGSSRMRELTMRLALGASRARLTRQLATEAALLTVAGAAGGLLLAPWLILLAGVLQRSAPSLFEPHVPRWADAVVDARVLGFACATAALTTLLLGVLPALRTSRGALHTRIAAGGRATGDRSLGRARHSLVTAQIALAVVLVTGAALLHRSVRALLALPLGFTPGDVVIADVAVSREYDAAAATSILEQWRDIVARRPEVEAAALAEQVPLAGSFGQTDFRIEGAPPTTAADAPKTEYGSVGPDYFRTIGARIVRGRTVLATDREDRLRVAVVNEAFARRHFGAADPIGRRVALSVEALRFVSDGPPVLDFASAYRTIVGVVADVRQSDLRSAPAPALYVPFAQRAVRRATLVVRSRAPLDAVHRLADAALRQVAPAQPLGRVRTLDTLVDAAVGDAATRAWLLGAFALVGGLFAVLGLYGVVAFAVTQRTRELGIRLVVGAPPVSLIWLVTRAALLATAAGVGAGLLLAALAATLVRRLLFAVHPLDLRTYVAVAVVLGTVALLASLAPALRVIRIRAAAVLAAE
jgi:putative ABC transport system permease protein